MLDLCRLSAVGQAFEETQVAKTQMIQTDGYELCAFFSPFSISTSLHV